LALGLGTDRLTKEDQTKNLMGNVYELKGKLNSEINPALASHNAHVFVSERKNGTSIKVATNDTPSKTLYNGDLQGALQFIKKEFKV
jgi:hypothetical protein